MALMGTFGEVQNIDCEVADGSVLMLDGGTQRITDLGEHYIEGAPFMPAECPLRKVGQTREIGDFAVCLSCTYAGVDYENASEC